MDAETLKTLLEEVRGGDVNVDDALSRIKDLPFRDLEFAKVDHHRALRCGFPEVIFCPGKEPDEIAAIAAEIVGNGSRLLATRASQAAFDAIEAKLPGAVYHARARAVTVRPDGATETPPAQSIGVICAGTSDLPVAEEARVTAEMGGVRVEMIRDVGVAGLHRILGDLPRMRDAAALVVVAGMEGALPSVVAGLVDRPVIAVPTSVGYGAAFGGLAALLAMLNSCANGVAVVNIDNGFGAGYMATLIARGWGGGAASGLAGDGVS